MQFNEHKCNLDFMQFENQQTFGSIIGLKKEFEERYIALHKHTFPEVLHRIQLSNITDYSIFLHNGVLFSHIVYKGIDYEADMKAIGSDETTREWWKLTDPMQQPLRSGNTDEWWSGLDLWFSYETSDSGMNRISRHAYTVPLPEKMTEKAPDQHFGDIDFWGTTYDLKLSLIHI
jgi:L-rhamnose mutarotase